MAEELARRYVDDLKKDPSLKEITVAGSYRRGKETVGDLDILVNVKQGSDIMTHFVTCEDVEHVISRGETRSSVVLRTGMQVDLRVVHQRPTAVTPWKTWFRRLRKKDMPIWQSPITPSTSPSLEVWTASVWQSRSKKIDRLNAKTRKFVVLKAIEVDILKDGSLGLVFSFSS